MMTTSVEPGGKQHKDRNNPGKSGTKQTNCFSPSVKMLFGTLLLPIVAVLIERTLAQSRTNATSTYYAAGIPTDRPIEGDYTDFLRPRVHFSPPRMFMNGKWEH
jgi:hypothetical protein